MAPAADLSLGCRKIDFKSATAKDEFNSSLIETGFAVLTNAPITAERINNVYREWCTFLKKVQATPALRDKYMYTSSATGHDGYFPPELAEVAKTAAVRDLKQYFQIYLKGGYPLEEEGVTGEARELFQDMLALGETLLEWIDEKLDEVSPEARAKLNAQGCVNLAETMSAERTMLRILHYPAYDPKDAEPGQLRSAPHEDINLITVLPAGSCGGLQLCVDGVNWLDVPFEVDSIIINIGDMLQELTCGVYRSTTHRVLALDTAVERMSVPCFIHPRSETYLSDKYPTADGYLKERLDQLARLNEKKNKLAA